MKFHITALISAQGYFLFGHVTCLANLKRVNFSYVEKLGSLGYDRTIVVILRPYTYQTITGEFRVGVGL